MGWFVFLCLAAAAFLILNVVAFLHAYRMTHFVSGGPRPGRPENLSPLQKVAVLLTGVRIPRPTCDVTPDSLGLTFSVHRFPSAGGKRIEAWHLPAAGEPPGICVAFHGFAASKSKLLPEAEALHALGYDLLLVDFRGSGGSDGTVSTIGYHEAHDVAAAAAFARKTYPTLPLILYGQSMGSAAILRAVATADVRPDAIVLECPFDRLLSTVASRFHAMGVPAFPLAHALVFWGGVQHGYRGFAHDPSEYARHVRCPVLMLNGACDPHVTTAQAESILRNLAGPKRLVLLPSLGHECYVSAEPEAWREAVRTFLDEAIPSVQRIAE